MRPILTGSVIATALALTALGACKKDDPPAQNPQGWQQGQGGYGGYGPQQPQPGYGQPAQPGYPAPQPGYPQQQPMPQPTTQPAAAPPPAAPAAGMNPTPQGVPCTSDAQCLTHKCNVAAQKCSWPCQGPADCAPGMQCLAPICVPMVGTAPAPAK